MEENRELKDLIIKPQESLTLDIYSKNVEDKIRNLSTALQTVDEDGNPLIPEEQILTLLNSMEIDEKAKFIYRGLLGLEIKNRIASKRKVEDLKGDGFVETLKQMNKTGELQAHYVTVQKDTNILETFKKYLIGTDIKKILPREHYVLLISWAKNRNEEELDKFFSSFAPIANEGKQITLEQVKSFVNPNKTEINTVSIKFKPGTYAVFRNLQNKYWYAIGEYVDNAVQSFEDNKAELIRTNNGKYQFEVRINIDWENDCIQIYDNAAGIDSTNFQRAFEPANIPIDNTGLHEFGMGMKTASIWLSDLWSVRTSALGEDEERFVEFDLNKVLAEEHEELQVNSRKQSKDSHFTEILLHTLSSNAPSAFQMDKLKRHLASIYRKFIRSGEMKLFVNNDDPLTYEDPEILKAPFYTKPTEKPIEWKKEINFSSGKYKVNGFIAILNKMSTSEINGLSLFRRGRVIEGSHDEKYRPKSICGQTGSPRYKRIFGELELEGFAVSFNKGSFQEQEDLEALMEALKTEISSKDFDLYAQAEKYLKPKTPDDNVKVAKSIISTFKKEVKQESFSVKVETSIKEIEDEAITVENQKQITIAEPIDSHEDIIEIKNEKYKLKVELITEPSIKDLYTLLLEDDELVTKKATYKINLAHPFFDRFEQFKNEDDYQPIVLIIRSLVLAEIHSPSQGTKNAGNIRTNFNSFLRNT